MKKLYFILLCLLIPIKHFGQIVPIPDVNFKSKLIQLGIDTNNDGEIQQSEAQIRLGLDIANSNISSLEGLQYFTNLTDLICSNNLMTEINLCGTKVYFIWADENPNLTTVNLKNNVRSYDFGGEPPFPGINFDNTPLVQNVCCDVDEYNYVNNIFYLPTTAVTTDCLSNCAVLNLSNSNNHSAFTVFPNPTKNNITIVLDEKETLLNITIHNTLGQLLKTISTQNTSLDLSEFHSGTYFITLETQHGKVTQKVIKL